MKRIICLYGGPGSGKTTTCAGLFYKLKLLNFDCEMNREYIKDWVWEDRKVQKGDQPYFFSKMARKERVYMEKGLDFIITDSPLVLTHFYGLKYDETEKKYNTSLMMLANHHQICKDNGYKVDHYFLNRVKPYNPNGRYQAEDEARLVDKELKEMLNSLRIKYQEVDGDSNAVDIILRNYVQNEINVPFHSFRTEETVILKG